MQGAKTIRADRAKRVAFNGRFLSRRQSGVQRVAYQLLRAIDQRASQTEAPAADYQLISPKNADVTDLNLRAMTTKQAGLTAGSQLWEQVELPALAGDRILVNLCNTAPLVSRGGITMMHDAQVHLSPSSYSPAFVAWYRLSAPVVAARSARIVTVSHFSKRMLVKYGVAEEDKITVVHNGVDHILSTGRSTDAVTRLGLAGRRFAMAMSNSQSHKNLAILFRAFSLPQLASVPLVLFGQEGPEAFGEQSIPPNVIFAGRLPDCEVRGLMEAARCFAFPSTTEGFGLPPLEAMSVGCPAVVAPCGALPEVCGEAAIYAAPDDPEAWARAILALVDDDDLRRDRSAQARLQAAKFTWDKAGGEIMDIIRQVSSAS